jgi:hypothetical protein
MVNAIDAPQRQVDQRGERDHRPAQRPEHEPPVVMDVEVEIPRPVDEGELEENQPQAACDEKPRHLPLRFSARQGQEDSGAREEGKQRCAEMRDPAREKNRRRRAGEVEGVDPMDRAIMEIITNVIQGHHDHDQAAQEIHGIETRHGGTRNDGAHGLEVA